MKMRRGIVFIVIASIASAGALCGFLLTLLVNGFFQFGDLRHEVPTCFEMGSPFHHRFRPDCKGSLVSPRGVIELKTNEDGLRDAPRAEIQAAQSRVLLVGDSFVEGWWATSAQTMSAALGRRLPKHRFINGGLRSTGPTLQVRRLAEQLRIYKPRAIIWLLNDTDTLDEKLACAVARNPAAPIQEREFDTPEIQFSSWKKKISELSGDSSFGRRVKLYFYEQRWNELVNSAAAVKCDACAGIREMKNLAEAEGIPFLTFYLAVDNPALSGHYANGATMRGQSFDCLEKAGVPVHRVDFTNLGAKDLERIFWKGDFHLSPEGMDYFVDRILPEVSRFLSPGRGEK